VDVKHNITGADRRSGTMSKYPDVSVPGPDAWAKAAAKAAPEGNPAKLDWRTPEGLKIGRASCRERVS
jgi:hypothetical protein